MGRGPFGLVLGRKICMGKPAWLGLKTSLCRDVSKALAGPAPDFLVVCQILNSPLPGGMPAWALLLPGKRRGGQEVRERGEQGLRALRLLWSSSPSQFPFPFLWLFQTRGWRQGGRDRHPLPTCCLRRLAQLVSCMGRPRLPSRLSAMDGGE